MRFKFAKNSFSKMFQIETSTFKAAIQSSEINIINDDAQLIYNDEIIIINTECPYDMTFDLHYNMTDRGFIFNCEANSFAEAVEKFKNFLDRVLEEDDTEAVIVYDAQ